MAHKLINSIFFFSVIVSLLLLTSLKINENHNFYLKKLTPSTWLKALDNLEFHTNYEEIVTNSAFMAEQNSKYEEIYEFLILKNYINLNK